MNSPNYHHRAFDPATRRKFAQLIRKHGILGAKRSSTIPVSAATLILIAREFEIPLRRGRRPMAATRLAVPRLSSIEHDRLRKLLAGGARSHGYNSERWTLRRVAELIERSFTVRCLSCHAEAIVTRLRMTIRRGVVDLGPAAGEPIATRDTAA